MKMKSLIFVLSVTLLTFVGQAPCRAKPSGFKQYQGPYIGNFTKGLLIKVPPPDLSLASNRFFIRLPSGKGTANGGFGFSPDGAGGGLFLLKNKIKKATLRQGGRKAILTGNSAVSAISILPIV